MAEFIHKLLVPPELRKYVGHKNATRMTTNVQLPKSVLTWDASLLFLAFSSVLAALPLIAVYLQVRPVTDTLVLGGIIYSAVIYLIHASTESLSAADSKHKRYMYTTWGIACGFVYSYVLFRMARLGMYEPEFFVLCLIIGATVTLPLAGLHGPQPIRMWRLKLRTFADVAIEIPSAVTLATVAVSIMMTMHESNTLLTTWPGTPIAACLVGRIAGNGVGALFVLYRKMKLTSGRRKKAPAEPEKKTQ